MTVDRFVFKDIDTGIIFSLDGSFALRKEYDQTKDESGFGYAEWLLHRLHSDLWIDFNNHDIELVEHQTQTVGRLLDDSRQT